MAISEVQMKGKEMVLCTPSINYARTTTGSFHSNERQDVLFEHEIGKGEGRHSLTRAIVIQRTNGGSRAITYIG